MSYCSRQTDWENPRDGEATDLAVQLNRAYPEVVRHLIGLAGGRLERDWLQQGSDDAHLLFLLQNKGVVSQLRDTRGMVTVRAAISERLPGLPPDNIEHSRGTVGCCPRGWQAFMDDDAWPVYLDIRAADAEQSTFTAYLCWSAANAVDAGEAERLRKIVTSVYPGFGKFGKARWRRTVLARGVDLGGLVDVVVDAEGRLARALATASGH